MAAAFSSLHRTKRCFLTVCQPHSVDIYVQLATTRHPSFRLNIGDGSQGHAAFGNYNFVAHQNLFHHFPINLIANGKTTQEANATGQSTDSMIASQVASQVTGGIQHLAGISSLQIDPLLGGNNQNPSARVAIQQRVTRNFLFTFSTDLSQPGSEIVQGDYQINKRWSVSLTRDEVGGVSVDGKYHTKF